MAAAAVLCTFALAACHSQQGSHGPIHPKSSAIALASTSSQYGDTYRSSPFESKASAVTSTATNYRDLLQHYSEAQQMKINAWYTRYATGSMKFESSAQWQWMQQHGYPTPDDVLRASAMPEQQLHDLAVRGDLKANFFYLARLLDGEDFTPSNDASSPPSQSKTSSRAKMSASMGRALASGSAFAGYMFGNYYAALHNQSVAGIGGAAGLTWADSMGDSRLVFTDREMAMGFPGVSGVHTAEVYFDMFATAARANPYFLNAKRGRGELFIPIQ